MRAPTLETVVPGDKHAHLVCPHCGCPYVHSGRVTVFDRPEDATVTRVTTIGGGVVVRDSLSRDIANPSARRHGMAITFACDECDLDAELTIAQEEGATVVAWREVPR